MLPGSVLSSVFETQPSRFVRHTRRCEAEFPVPISDAGGCETKKNDSPPRGIKSRPESPKANFFFSSLGRKIIAGVDRPNSLYFRVNPFSGQPTLFLGKPALTQIISPRGKKSFFSLEPDGTGSGSILPPRGIISPPGGRKTKCADRLF